MSQMITVLGRNGSGKSTIAGIIAATYGFTHVSSGDVARQLAQTDPETEAALARGALAPRQKMNDAMLGYLNSHRRIVLDGFPRYFEQLADVLLFRPTSLFIVLDLDEESAYARLLARKRDDDTPKAIWSRLHTFDHETAPMLRWLQRRLPNNVVNIDARPPVRKVVDSVGDVLDWWFGVQVRGADDR